MEKRSMRKIMLLITLAVLLYVAGQNLAVILGMLGTAFSVITPLILGGCIAFILNLPMSFFERLFMDKLGFSKKKGLRKLARPLSFTIALLIFITVIYLLCVIVLPELANSILSLGSNVPGYIEQITHWGQSFFDKHPQIAEGVQGIEVNWNEIGSTIFSALKNSSEAILDSTVLIAGNIINGIISFFVSMVMAIYILFHKEKLFKHAKRLLNAFVPRKWSVRIQKVAILTQTTFTRFLAGQCLEAAILGTLIFIGMSIFSFPYALMISIVIAVASFVPMVGIYVASVAGAILIAIQNPLSGVLFMVMFLVIQQIEGNFIYPHVVGNSVGVSPIIVFSAILVGGGFFGLVGMIVAVPTSAVIYALYKEAVSNRLKKRKAVLCKEKTEDNSDAAENLAAIENEKAD